MHWDKIRKTSQSPKSIHIWQISNLSNPKSSSNAVLEFYKESMSSGGTRWQKWIDCVEDARRMAAFIGARFEEIAFTHSTSEGMNIIPLACSPWPCIKRFGVSIFKSTVDQQESRSDNSSISEWALIELIRKAIGRKLKRSSPATFSIRRGSSKTWRH